MKNYTETDVQPHGSVAGAGSLTLDNYPSDLVSAPLGWHKLRLSKTTSGYGAKMETEYKISFNGKLSRLYITCYGNTSSTWFTVRGRKVFVN